MDYSQYYLLRKPESSDFVDIRDINYNTDVIDLMFHTATNFVAGHYVGTGTYGSSNPNSLTFSFVPECLLIYGDGLIAQYWGIWTKNGTYVNLAQSTQSSGLLPATLDGKTVSWYCSMTGSGTATTAPKLQLNQSGQTYRYIALG